MVITKPSPLEVLILDDFKHKLILNVACAVSLQRFSFTFIEALQYLALISNIALLLFFSFTFIFCLFASSIPCKKVT